MPFARDPSFFLFSYVTLNEHLPLSLLQVLVIIEENALQAVVIEHETTIENEYITICSELTIEGCLFPLFLSIFPA